MAMELEGTSADGRRQCLGLQDNSSPAVRWRRSLRKVTAVTEAATFEALKAPYDRLHATMKEADGGAHRRPQPAGLWGWARWGPRRGRAPGLPPAAGQAPPR